MRSEVGWNTDCEGPSLQVTGKSLDFILGAVETEEIIYLHSNQNSVLGWKGLGGREDSHQLCRVSQAVGEMRYLAQRRWERGSGRA